MILYYLLVSVMPLIRHPVWSEIVGELTVIKYLGVGCLLYTVFHLLQSRTTPRFLDTVQARWFWALIGLSTVSYLTIGSSDPFEISPLIAYISFGALFFITLSVVDSIERLRNVLLVAVGSIAFASLYVLREWQKAGFAAGSRPGWVTGDPNYFTVSALVFLPMALQLREVARNRAERVFCVVCFGVTLLAVFGAASRGGFLGLLVIWAYFWLRSRRRAAIVALAAAAMAAMFVLPGSPLTRFMNPASGDVESSDTRLRLWTIGMRAALEHPLTGIGPGNFRTLTEGGEDFQVAHNTYVEMAAELGFPGLVLFLAVLGTTFVSAGRIRRDAGQIEASPFLHLAQGIQGGLLGYASSAFFVSIAWGKSLWLLVFLSIALNALWQDARLAGEVTVAHPVTPPTAGDEVALPRAAAMAQAETRGSRAQ